jgi:hypothetical protein
MTFEKIVTMLVASLLVINLITIPVSASTDLFVGASKINTGAENLETGNPLLAGATVELLSIVSTSIEEAESARVEVGATEEEFEYGTNGFTNTSVILRKEPSVESDKVSTIYINSAIKYQKSNTKKDDGWTAVQFGRERGFIKSKYISDHQVIIERRTKKKASSNSSVPSHTSAPSTWNGEKLSRSSGRVSSPGGGTETYYNLDMSGVIRIMRNMGNNDDYWVRSDGCKMLGQYIMIAANLNIHPRGSIVDTTLGKGIVCDTGTFIRTNPYGYDIATTW